MAVGAGATTAHGLYEVAAAARVPVAVAWLYPVITDGLALVAYASTARLSNIPARRYAWSVVVVAAGLSGLAQATYLAGAVGGHASAVLRFGVGAWPAIAAATVAHLLYLIASTTHTDAGTLSGTLPVDHLTAAVPDGAVPADGQPEPQTVPATAADPRTGTAHRPPLPEPDHPVPGGTAEKPAPTRPGRARRSDADLLAQLNGRTKPMSVRAAARELGTGPDRARRLLRQAGLLAVDSQPADQAAQRALHVVTNPANPQPGTPPDSNSATEDHTDHEQESRTR